MQDLDEEALIARIASNPAMCDSVNVNQLAEQGLGRRSSLGDTPTSWLWHRTNRSDQIHRISVVSVSAKS